MMLVVARQWHSEGGSPSRLRLRLAGQAQNALLRPYRSSIWQATATWALTDFISNNR